MHESQVIRIPTHAPVNVAPGITMYEINFTQQTPPPFEAIYFTIAPGFATPCNQHIETECWMIMKGQGQLTYDGKISHIKQGDIVYFEPNKSHTVTNTGTDTLLIYSLYW